MLNKENASRKEVDRNTRKQQRRTKRRGRLKCQNQGGAGERYGQGLEVLDRKNRCTCRPSQHREL